MLRQVCMKAESGTNALAAVLAGELALHAEKKA